MFKGIKPSLKAKTFLELMIDGNAEPALNIENN